MTIRVAADVQIPGAEKFVGRNEEVFLPLDDGQEEKYVFTIQPVDMILRANKKARRVPAAEAQALVEEASDAWLAAGFGPEAWQHIQERIDDPTDVLREGHIQFLLQELTQQVIGGRPTTSSNGASRQPWESTSTAAPSVPVSVSGTSNQGISAT